MAQQYYLYTTDFNNTLVERSDNSFAPLPPNTGEIFINFFIPTNQPLYYYRESGGTIVLNDEATINAYLEDVTPFDPNEPVGIQEFTGYTATTQQTIDQLGVSNSFYAFSKTSSTGVQLNGFKLNVSFVSTGVYDYTFDQPLLNSNYAVSAQPFNTVTDTNAQISNITTNGFRVTIGVGDNGTSPDTPTNTQHSVVVFGVPISGNTIPSVGISDFTGYTATTQSQINSKLDGVVGGTNISIDNTDPNNPIINFTGTSGGADGVVSGATLNGAILELKRTESLSDVTVNLSNITGNTLSISEFNTYTGITDNRITDVENDITFISGQTSGNTQAITDNDADIAFISGVTDNNYNDFTGYTATTQSQLVNVFEPLDGVTPDDQRFEDYANEQALRGQPIYFHDPNDFGFVFTGLTTGNAYNTLPWIGIDGGNSSPRLKLGSGSQVFTTSGIRGVELFIDAGSTVEILGLSEHAQVDLTEIRFGIAASVSTLTVRAVNMTVGRIEGQIGTTTLNIRDRTNMRVQNLNEIENVNVEGGTILEANWIRGNTILNVGTVDGVTPDTDPAIVTVARGVNITTGKIVIFGNDSIVTASQLDIDILSGATKNTIIGSNNTISDNGTNTIILENLGNDGVVSGATLNGAILELKRTEGLPDVTVDLSSLSGSTGGGDGVVSGATISGNTLILSRTESLSDVTVNLSQFNQSADISFISGATNEKIDKVTGGTGNVGTFTSSGNLQDSGLSIADITGATIPATVNKLQLIDTSGGQTLNDVTPNPIEWGGIDIIDTNVFSFTTGNSSITVLQDGFYELSYNVNGNSSGGNRAVVGVQYRVNGSVVAATLTTNYRRNGGNSHTNNALPPYIQSLNANDVVDVVAFRLGDSQAQVTTANQSFTRINYLGQ